jgi:hypothetical protein
VILGPILVLVAIWSLVAPTSLSPGDYRNDPVFRVLMAAAFIAGGVGAFIASARWLIADRRK